MSPSDRSPGCRDVVLHTHDTTSDRLHPGKKERNGRECRRADRVSCGISYLSRYIKAHHLRLVGSLIADGSLLPSTPNPLDSKHIEIANDRLQASILPINIHLLCVTSASLHLPLHLGITSPIPHHNTLHCLLDPERTRRPSTSIDHGYQSIEITIAFLRHPVIV